ncbi:MAG: IS256 family transposase [Eubacteriales bacterium]|jgi:putative transposase
MHERKRELVGLLAQECTSLEEVQTLLKSLFKGTIEQMLEAEMDEHLGYEKHNPQGDGSGNSRNGYNKKTIKSELGEAEISIPRDRNGEFIPQIISKHQTKTDNLEKRIIAMYAKGMSNRDIEDHLRDIYGVEASASLISRITDKIMPAVVEWQSRTLESIYPIVFLDGIVFKVRQDNKVINKCVYTVLGIDLEGSKDILGIWISENESASFWLSVCNELKNRGVKDIIIACRDNLSGFSAAIETVFPKTEQQLCIIHQIRSSTKYVARKDLQVIMNDLRKVYGAITQEEAEYYLAELEETWGKKYPQLIKSWRTNWADIIPFFKYPEELRRLIYTTNTVEGFHRMLRKYTKNKTIFPSDDAVKKSVYLSVNEISKKWNHAVKNWGVIMGQLMIFFEDRFQSQKVG